MQLRCAVCEAALTDLGAYVRLGAGRHMHLACYDAWRLPAYAAERAAAEQAARETELRKEFDRLPRCARCGVRRSDGGASYRAEWGEVRATSPAAAGVCVQCVREEVAARQAARGVAPPPVSVARTSPVVAQAESREEKLVREAADSGIAIELE